MQFIIEQQAQFASDIQQLKEVQVTQHAQFSAEIQELKEAQAKSVAGIRQLTEAETSLMRAMTTVVGMIGETNNRVVRLETALADLAERINAFIAALGNGRGRRPNRGKE